MKFKIIFFASVLSFMFYLANTSLSYAQVIWNIFEEKRGLFSIQLPSNWNVTEMKGDQAFAPIDYMFQYNSQDNSFAWVELMISEPLYTNTRAALDSYISEYQQFDDFNQLLPIECNINVLDNSTACFLLSSQQLEGELKRNVLNMVSISPDGVQTDIVFITSSNVFNQLLPVGEFIIKSLNMNTSKISQELKEQAIENLQVEIPAIPPAKDTVSSTPSKSENTPNGIMNSTSSQQQETFFPEVEIFVTSMPQEFGIYNVRTNNLFALGEDILLYIEPKGFSYETMTNNSNKTLYSINFDADFTISDTNGNILTEQRGISVNDITSHHQNKEIFIPFTITQTSPFPPGNYIITYTIHDENSGNSFTIDKEIVITESQTA
ncbi:MAG TPA: hypothetical protein VFG45_04890 [Candidatus Nitrosocosmicus sp.]|nr:hypothetical protein [Candidatus Nitrosocosmicus sp.]